MRKIANDCENIIIVGCDPKADSTIDEQEENKPDEDQDGLEELILDYGFIAL